MKKLLLILSLGLCVVCCKDKKATITEIYSKLEGKNVLFPEGMEIHMMGRDTLCSDLIKLKAKILVYIDSNGCTPCKMHLDGWMLRKEEADSIDFHLPIIYVVDTPDIKLLDDRLRRYWFTIPIFYDIEHNMFTKNTEVLSQGINTFLLDKDNKIVLVGSPVNNDKLWELYKKEIARLSAEK